MRNIYIGPHVINIGGLTEAELEKLQKQLEAAVEAVEETLNRETEEESCPN